MPCVYLPGPAPAVTVANTYFRINKLSLHPEKSKYLRITHKNNTIGSEDKIYIDNITLPNIINPKSLSPKEFPTVIRFLQ